MPVTVPPRLRRHRPGQLTLALPRVPGCCGHPELAAHPESDSRLDTESDTGPLPRIPDPGTDRPAGPRRGQRGTTRPGHPRPRDNRPPRQAQQRGRRVAEQRPPSRPGRPQPRPDLQLPRHWSVEFTVLDGLNAGKVKLSSPQARGWSKVIRPFPDAVKEAITEARLYVAEQGHAAWRGQRSELDVYTAHDDPDEPPPPKVADLAEVKAKSDLKWKRTYSKHSRVRPDQDDLTQWTVLPPKADGSPGGWQSKDGRNWKVPPKGTLGKIRDAGLPTTWEEYCEQQSGFGRSAVG